MVTHGVIPAEINQNGLVPSVSLPNKFGAEGVGRGLLYI